MATTPGSVGESNRAGRPRLTARARLVVAVDPLAWVLLLAGVVDGFSDNWVHAVFLIVAAMAVWADHWARAAGHPGRPSVPLLRGRAGTGSRRARGVALAGVALYAVVAGSMQPYSWPMTVAVVLPAAAGLVLAWRGPLREGPVPPKPGRTAALAWWAVLVVGGLWELTALLMQPSIDVGSAAHPTISFLMDSVLASPAGRMLTIALWLALGWFLLAQAPSDPVPKDSDELA
jgi:hypothetical protein